MRATPLHRIDRRLTSEAIREAMQPQPRDYTAELLDWFDRLDSRIKWAVLVVAVWFAVWALFTGPEW